MLMDVSSLCMAASNSGVSTNIGEIVSRRGMLARPQQGSATVPTGDPSARRGGEHNSGGGGPGRTMYAGRAGDAGTSHTRGTETKSAHVAEGESESESG